jgi:hypothetical protein
MVAMLVPIFWVGIYPDSFLRLLHRPAEDLLELMRSKSAAVARIQPRAVPARTQAWLAAALPPEEIR